MEVMEDGNLMDKVHILIQRDMEYYKDKQKVLQETVCAGVVGGHLDFPRYASFAAVKLVLWWEEEFIAAYRHGSGFMQQITQLNEEALETSGGCGGIVKSSDPPKFVALITKSAEQLLDHLHVLTQEALDHADLSVLTGTIGAAALLKNCLWCYIHSLQESDNALVIQLQTALKKYQEMCEALAERLLDLHCRLLSLYILQDADSLDWESPKAFCESERGSYAVQMWWLYMQGTKEDLWNTVPPKMAQRVFSGMLNETLSILTVRYAQACPTENRSQLLVVDISNLLLCVAKLLPSICNNAEELLGVSLTTQSKILRDIHIKCQELKMCLVLRGAPLDTVYKSFQKEAENHPMLKPRSSGPCPWIILTLQNTFVDYPKTVESFCDLPSNIAIFLEISVLLAQPEPHWSLLVKVLLMKNYTVLKMILHEGVKEFSEDINAVNIFQQNSKCTGFLCPRDDTCKTLKSSTHLLEQHHYYEIIMSVTHIFLSTGSSDDLSRMFLPEIAKSPTWAQCFDRRHVWSQKRPPWYEAILDLVRPILPPIVKAVISSAQTGASMYQAMSIVLACFSQLWDCVNPVFAHIAALLQDILPLSVTPLGHSTLLQLLVSALYSELLKRSQEQKKSIKFSVDHTKSEVVANGCEKQPSTSNIEKDAMEHKSSITSFDGTIHTVESIALALAEALCSIDEDNKHTEQIEQFLDDVKESLSDLHGRAKDAEHNSQAVEVMASDLLSTSYGKRNLKCLFHFIQSNQEWFYQKFGAVTFKDVCLPNKTSSTPNPLTYTMFHIDNCPFDQLLTGEWKFNWLDLLHTPMGVTAERIWNQLSHRWEFQDVNSPHVHLVANISKILKQL